MFEIFRKHKLSKLALGFVVTMVLLIIPLTIIQVQKQQEIRQHAQSLSPLSLSLDPPAITAETNKPFTVAINLNNSEKKDISGFDITIAFAKELVLSPFDTSTSIFSIVIKDQSIPGTFRLVGVNPSLEPINNPVIKLGEMKFTAAKTMPETKILFEKVSVTGAGGLIFSDTLNNLPASSGSVGIVPPIPTTPTPKPIPISQCVIDDCGGPGACSFDATCAQVGSGRKNCECVANSSLTPTVSPPTPTPTPTPKLTALCTFDDCFKLGKFCREGFTCKQNPDLRVAIKDCTCQPTTPAETPTPTPTPSNQCTDSDCRNQNLICAPGSACLQNPSSLVKSCSCRSTVQPSPTPTPTPTIAPTPLPGSSLLALSLKISGIGTASAENLPRTKSRAVKVIVRTPTQDIEKTGVINFDTSDGLFKTDPKRPVDLGTSIPTNTPFDLVIKVDFFKGFVSDISLSKGPNPAPKTPTLQVGLDDSGNVDAVSYFNVLTSCFGEKSCTNKLGADLNDDGNVDGVDFNIFLKSIRAITSR